MEGFLGLIGVVALCGLAYIFHSLEKASEEHLEYLRSHPDE